MVALATFRVGWMSRVVARRDPQRNHGWWVALKESSLPVRAEIGKPVVVGVNQRPVLQFHGRADVEMAMP
jgi:hypothetical protein